MCERENDGEGQRVWGKECACSNWTTDSVIPPLQVHFLICISANITHLRDNRFATLNAYETEELRNSKHSVLDTNM